MSLIVLIDMIKVLIYMCRNNLVDCLKSVLQAMNLCYDLVYEIATHSILKSKHHRKDFMAEVESYLKYIRITY